MCHQQSESRRDEDDPKLKARRSMLDELLTVASNAVTSINALPLGLNTWTLLSISLNISQSYVSSKGVIHLGPEDVTKQLDPRSVCVGEVLLLVAQPKRPPNLSKESSKCSEKTHRHGGPSSSPMATVF